MDDREAKRESRVAPNVTSSSQLFADDSAAGQSLENQRVLVTGGAGFIGSHLARALVSDNDVTVYDSMSEGDRSNVPDDAELIEADVRTEETLDTAVAEADLVFHEAAQVSVERSIEDPATTQAINADATLALLEAARRHDARVILASSAAIYGHPKTTPIAESDPKMPTSPYGMSKLSLDHYARLYHDLYGLDTVALRYFNVYGPGQTPGDYAGVISIFVKQALADEPITVEGDGEQTRDFIYIDDIVQANLRAATTDAVGTAYNVATSTSISIRELAERIRDIADANSEIVHKPAREGDIRHSVADIDRARTDLGFEPTVEMDGGLKRTIEWFRDR